MFWHLYTALEQGLDQHATHPAIETTYNPALLSRVDALSSDISYLLQVPEDVWQSHPTHVELTANTPACVVHISQTDRRVQHLRRAAKSVTESMLRALTLQIPQLLSHAYVRYPGDTSGGQNIRYAVGKDYNIELDST